MRNQNKKQMKQKEKIGFIGQGWIGKNYADNFEKRGFEVVRYSMEEPYVRSKEEIKKCDIVFIAVPTPTTKRGFDDKIVDSVLTHIGRGKTAVIKSTTLPGTIKKLQKKYPDITILHSPEFLTKATAVYDTSNPARNIVGIPTNTPSNKKKAKYVLSILPRAPVELICSSDESELIKYGSNCFYYTKVVFFNILFDLAKKLDLEWKPVELALKADPMIGKSHVEPLHKSGRGAGGVCLLKDFEAFSQLVNRELGAKEINLMRAIRDKNLALLALTRKDEEFVRMIYGRG